MPSAVNTKLHEAEQRRHKARDAELSKLYRPIGVGAVLGALSCRMKRQDDKKTTVLSAKPQPA